MKQDPVTTLRAIDDLVTFLTHTCRVISDLSMSDDIYDDLVGLECS